MAIVAWPDDVSVPAAVVCVICREARPAGSVSAGMEDTSHRLTFACDVHFGLASSYIVGWADFITAEWSKADDFPHALQLAGTE